MVVILKIANHKPSSNITTESVSIQQGKNNLIVPERPQISSRFATTNELRAD
jgi:hypothetical protein